MLDISKPRQHSAEMDDILRQGLVAGERAGDVQGAGFHVGRDVEKLERVELVEDLGQAGLRPHDEDLGHLLSPDHLLPPFSMSFLNSLSTSAAAFVLLDSTAFSSSAVSRASLSRIEAVFFFSSLRFSSSLC